MARSSGGAVTGGVRQSTDVDGQLAALASDDGSNLAVGRAWRLAVDHRPGQKLAVFIVVCRDMRVPRPLLQPGGEQDAASRRGLEPFATHQLAVPSIVDFHGQRRTDQPASGADLCGVESVRARRHRFGPNAVFVTYPQAELDRAVLEALSCDSYLCSDLRVFLLAARHVNSLDRCDADDKHHSQKRDSDDSGALHAGPRDDIAHTILL